MTQRELAQRAGLSMSAISQLETGLGVASIRTIHLLARALDLPHPHSSARRSSKMRRRTIWREECLDAQ